MFCGVYKFLIVLMYLILNTLEQFNIYIYKHDKTHKNEIFQTN